MKKEKNYKIQDSPFIVPTDDGKIINLPEAANVPIEPHFIVPDKPADDLWTDKLTKKNGKKIREDLTYGCKVARHDVGSKML